MRVIRNIFFLTAIVILTAFSVYSLEGLERHDNSVFDAPQRPAAIFDHDDHNEKAGLEDDCSVCHHVYEGKKIIENESSEDSLCSDCHSVKASAENSIPLRMAFHKQCRTCHFNTKNGPVFCGECHKRK